MDTPRWDRNAFDWPLNTAKHPAQAPRFGSAYQNVLRGNATNTTDIGIFKAFPIKERYRLSSGPSYSTRSTIPTSPIRPRRWRIPISAAPFDIGRPAHDPVWAKVLLVTRAAAFVFIWAAWGQAENPEALARARMRTSWRRRATSIQRRGSRSRRLHCARESAVPVRAGWHLRAGGKVEQAVAAFAEAVRLDPANPTLNSHLEAVSLDWGAALARSKRFRAGLAHARKTATRFPKSSRAYLIVGLFEARNQENLAAVAAYRRAVELDPESADASVGLGVAHRARAGERRGGDVRGGAEEITRDAMHRQAYGVLLARMAVYSGFGERAVKC